MSEHKVHIEWNRATENFQYETYNRQHTWKFDSGIEVQASSAPEYLGSPGCVDPEEALVAALSSCHMLTFLAVAAKKRLTVDRYEDDAVGFLEKNADGKLAIARVTLRPRVVFSGGNEPDASALRDLHDKAHHACFIANSVKTEVVVTPR